MPRKPLSDAEFLQLEQRKKDRAQFAIAANMRRHEKKAADKLTERGWGVVTIYEETEPEEIEKVNIQIAQAIALLRKRGYKITKG